MEDNGIFENYVLMEFINQNPQHTQNVADEVKLLWIYKDSQITIQDIVMEQIQFGCFKDVEYNPLMTDLDKYFVTQDILSKDLNSIFSGISGNIGSVANVAKEMFLKVDDHYVPVKNPESFSKVFGFVKNNSEKIKDCLNLKIQDLKIENYVSPVVEKFTAIVEKANNPKLA